MTKNANDQARQRASLASITASAVTPDQLLPYVLAVSGLSPRRLASSVAYQDQDGEGPLVLVAYPEGRPEDEAERDAAVAAALELPGLGQITVLSASRPTAAPDDASQSEDTYWSLPIPPPEPGQKLRNLLRRAGRELEIVQSSGPDCWTPDHAALVDDFCQRRKLDAGTIHIFHHLDAYLARAGEAVLFTAWTKGDKSLAGCAIGDFSAMATAFYMFAFRYQTAPPGTADGLLAAICAEAGARGHSQINLGLGIDPGVSFFKKKWGAKPFLPLVETSWKIARQAKKTKKGWLARLFGG